MDFEKVFNVILKQFEEQDIQYALIGGFALGAIGIMRSTIDLDFLILNKDMDKVDGILTGSMYRAVFKSENVSQYVSDAEPFGQIDIIHAFREVSVSMLKRARNILVFNKYNIKIAIPEDIIGLKLQAMVNDKERENIESADIELILQYLTDKKEDIDWGLLEEYFSLFDLNEKFNGLKNKYYRD